MEGKNLRLTAKKREKKKSENLCHNSGAHPAKAKMCPTILMHAESRGSRHTSEVRFIKIAAFVILAEFAGLTPD